jgi:hypothetical protein
MKGKEKETEGKGEGARETGERETRVERDDRKHE